MMIKFEIGIIFWILTSPLADRSVGSPMENVRLLHLEHLDPPSELDWIAQARSSSRTPDPSADSGGGSIFKNFNDRDHTFDQTINPPLISNWKLGDPPGGFLEEASTEIGTTDSMNNLLASPFADLWPNSIDPMTHLLNDHWRFHADNTSPKIKELEYNSEAKKNHEPSTINSSPKKIPLPSSYMDAFEETASNKKIKRFQESKSRKNASKRCKYTISVIDPIPSPSSAQRPAFYTKLFNFQPVNFIQKSAVETIMNLKRCNGKKLIDEPFDKDSRIQKMFILDPDDLVKNGMIGKIVQFMHRKTESEKTINSKAGSQQDKKKARKADKAQTAAAGRAQFESALKNISRSQSSTCVFYKQVWERKFSEDEKKLANIISQQASATSDVRSLCVAVEKIKPLYMFLVDMMNIMIPCNLPGAGSFDNQQENGGKALYDFLALVKVVKSGNKPSVLTNSQIATVVLDMFGNRSTSPGLRMRLLWELMKYWIVNWREDLRIKNERKWEDMPNSNLIRFLKDLIFSWSEIISLETSPDIPLQTS